MSSSSDDDVPLAELLQQQTAGNNGSHLKAMNGAAAAQGTKDSDSGSSSSSDDSDDDVPLSMRIAKIATNIKIKRKSPRKPAGSTRRKRSKSSSASTKRQSSGPSKAPVIRWNTLEHHGVLFPPEYVPHGVKMLYDGVPVDLTPEQEEVASFFAVMKETDYMSKQIFLDNFWEGFRTVLGPNHRIKSLNKCDFTPIYDYHIAERERKKELPKEEKLRIKEEKDAKEAPYKFALIDGKKEPVGNFRVEPPGLFRGRGEHPKMGIIKRRIYPEDISINISKGAPIPTHPFGPSRKWKEVKHDNTVTWLAGWRDPVLDGHKYVMLAATSTWKTEEDLAKYERARKLKDYIGDIRETYTRNWSSASFKERQMVGIDLDRRALALRAPRRSRSRSRSITLCALRFALCSSSRPPHSTLWIYWLFEPDTRRTRTRRIRSAAARSSASTSSSRSPRPSSLTSSERIASATRTRCRSKPPSSRT